MTPTRHSPPPEPSTDLDETPETLRNPPLASSPDQGKTGRSLPGPETGGSPMNAASNGYWLHDRSGAKAYVAPDAPPDAARLIADIEAQMGTVRGLDASRVHVSLEEGAILLTGRIDGTEARRRAGACAVAVAGEVPVINRLIVSK